MVTMTQNRQGERRKDKTMPPPASQATACRVDNNAEDNDDGIMGTRMTMTMDGDMIRQQAEGDAMMGQLLLSRFCILVV
jgi:Tfp pilus assembly major pilin PilA